MIPLITTPVPAVSTPVPQRTQGQADFDTNADAFLASLPPVAEGINDAAMEFNALAVFVNNTAELVEADRVQVALDSAQSAANAASALNSAQQAAISEAEALMSKNAAASSAVQAQIAQSNSLSNAGSSAASAAQASTSLAGTLAAAVLSGAKAYATYALAIADFANQVNNQTVFVATDETSGNQGVYYKASGTPVNTLVFLRFQEYYTSPVVYIPSDNLQNTLTRLFVQIGAIPQNPATIDSDFTNPTYL